MPDAARAAALRRRTDAFGTGDDMKFLRHRRRPFGRALATLGTLAIVVAGAVPSAVACDLCAIYTATEMREARVGPEIGVGEQFSHFTTLRDDGHKIDNTAHERMDSAITQLLFGYTFNPRFGVQLTVPIIARTFHRLEDGILRQDDENGFGDLSLIGIARPFSDVSDAGIVGLSLF